MNPVHFRWANSALALALMLLFAMKLFAQDKQVDVNIGVDKGGAWLHPTMGMDSRRSHFCFIAGSFIAQRPQGLSFDLD